MCPSAEVRRRLDGVDDVLLVLELRPAEQLVGVVGEVDQRHAGLDRADLEAVHQVGDELQLVVHALVTHAPRHVHAEHQVDTTAARYTTDICDSMFYTRHLPVK